MLCASFSHSRAPPVAKTIFRKLELARRGLLAALLEGGERQEHLAETAFGGEEDAKAPRRSIRPNLVDVPALRDALLQPQLEGHVIDLPVEHGGARNFPLTAGNRRSLSCSSGVATPCPASFGA